tara:strand:+ start:1153 stop:1434 length:282 start_codon:yes stop_codon:yes gene_type:complete
MCPREILETLWYHLIGSTKSVPQYIIGINCSTFNNNNNKQERTMRNKSKRYKGIKSYKKRTNAHQLNKRQQKIDRRQGKDLTQQQKDALASNI